MSENTSTTRSRPFDIVLLVDGFQRSLNRNSQRLFLTEMDVLRDLSARLELSFSPLYGADVNGDISNGVSILSLFCGQDVVDGRRFGSGPAQ